MIEFACSDPQPPFEDIIDWITEALCDMVNPVRPRAQFVAILPEGACESWTFVPHQPSECVRKGKDPSLKEALEFANRMLFTTPGACVQATWKLDSLDATIASTAEPEVSQQSFRMSMDTPKHYDMRLRFEHEFANGVNVIALVDLDELRADAPGIELSMDGNVAPTLRRGWENNIEKESHRIIKLLDNAPSSGDGAHTFLARVATRTAMHWTAEQTYRWLRDYGDRCGRCMPDREINEAIADGRRFAGVTDNGTSIGKPASRSIQARRLPQSPRWPEPDQTQIATICRKGPGLAELSACSPSPPKDDAPRTEEIIDLLFGNGNPWLCCGVASYEFSTQRREEWRGRLSDQSFIVPSAMIGKYGFTKHDKVSEHAQSAVGSRRHLVVEFDFSEKTRDGTRDTAFAPQLRSLGADGVTVADMCAALLAHLAKVAPMVLVVHSGGKSLHGWFPCAGIAEGELRKFMAYACELGADPKTWTASQFVRTPDGLRYAYGQSPRRQHVCFWNPEILSHV